MPRRLFVICDSFSIPFAGITSSSQILAMTKRSIIKRMLDFNPLDSQLYYRLRVSTSLCETLSRIEERLGTIYL